MPPSPQQPRKPHPPEQQLDPKLEALRAVLAPHLTSPPPQAAPPPPLQTTGLPEIDRLLGGGFPTGALSEITGSHSSGRTSLLLALLAHATREEGAHVALIDPSDGFDPLSAEASGVVLERILWVRAREWRAALRATECLLETDGFPLVVLDWARACPSEQLHRADAAWLRLTRLAASHRSSLLLLSSERLAGPRAAVVLEMQPAVARFSRAPALLEELEMQAVLVRHRAAPEGRMVRLRLSLGLEAPPSADAPPQSAPTRPPSFTPRARRKGDSNAA